MYKAKTMSYLRFRVRATDQGNLAMLYKSADVVVNVEDLNDNSPVFSDNPFTGEIAHDDTLGNKIVTVRQFNKSFFAQEVLHKRLISLFASYSSDLDD